MDKSLHIYFKWFLNKVTIPSTGKEAKKLELPYTDGTMQNGTIWHFLIREKICLPYDLAIQLGITQMKRKPAFTQKPVGTSV